MTKHIQSARGIQHVAVLGAGTMGPGMAQVFAAHGRTVTMWTRSVETRDKARTSLRKSLETFAAEGLLPQEQVGPAFGRVTFCATVEEAVAGADLVMETIVENKDAKIALYGELEKLLGGGVIVASNTSGLNIFELAPPRLLSQLLIAHWYAPPQVIPLVEVVKSEQAPEAYAALLVDLLEECGKTPVLMKKFIQGYIVNRMQMCLNNEIFHLLDNDFCTPEDIDRAVKASFIPRAMVLGLCKRADFGGLDMTANNFRNKSYTPPPPVADVPETLRKHLEKGELGVKSGKGLYDYTGMDKQELLAKRDRQLFEAFRLAAKLMDDPV